MSELSLIRTKVRYMISDVEKQGNDVFIYGSDDLFTLSEKNVSEVTSIRINNASPLGSGDYSFDTETEKVELTVSGMNTGDVIDMSYLYTKYSDDEIDGYIRSALIYLSTNNYYTFQEENDEIYPEPSDREINLLALITSVLIQGTTASIRTPDLTLQFNEKLSVFDKIQKIISTFKKDTHGSFGILGGDADE